MTMRKETPVVMSEITPEKHQSKKIKKSSNIFEKLEYFPE